MYHHVKQNAFSSDYLLHVEEQLLASPHIGPSPLGKEFVNTRGFSIVFRRSSLDDVTENFSYLADFLSCSLFPSSNAFYINPLILSCGSRVEQHVDCRLLARENLRIIPNIVSILYVKVDPAMLGGELRLYTDSDNYFAHNPKTNDLVHFLGTLVHSVGEVRTPSSRICIVCEQYNLPDQVLGGFPEFQIIHDKDVAPRLALVDNSSY